MAKRFNNLKAALKYLRPVGATEGSIAVDAPEGSQLRHFQDFKSGKLTIKIIRAADSLPGDETYCSLKPFALLPTETGKFLVNLSKRSHTNIGAAGLTEEILGIDATPTGTADLEKVKGFMPAKVTIAVIPAGVGKDTVSKITGDSYKKKEGVKTYTYPFGASVTHPSLKQAKAAIIAAAGVGGTNKSLSFKPERF